MYMPKAKEFLKKTNEKKGVRKPNSYAKKRTINTKTATMNKPKTFTFKSPTAPLANVVDLAEPQIVTPIAIESFKKSNQSTIIKDTPTTSKKPRFKPTPTLGQILNAERSMEKRAMVVKKKREIVNNLNQAISKNLDVSLDNESISKKVQQSIEKLNKLLSHTKNKMIKLVRSGGGNNKAFWITDDNGKDSLYPGLTKTLKKLFYPNTEEDPAKKKAKGEAERKPRNKESQSNTRTCELYGKDHGIRVHNEIDIYVKYSKDKEMSAILPDPDPCTIRILNFLAEKKWIPLLSEFDIWNKKMRVATRIDLIVYEATTGKIILLEIKTGYEGEEYGPRRGDKKLERPLHKISNCPLNRHLLQVVLMNIMLERDYKFHVDESYILRTLPKARKTIAVSLAKWCSMKSVKKNIYDLMCMR